MNPRTTITRLLPFACFSLSFPCLPLLQHSKHNQCLPLPSPYKNQSKNTIQNTQNTHVLSDAIKQSSYVGDTVVFIITDGALDGWPKQLISISFQSINRSKNLHQICA
eukprot:962591_1